MTYIPAHPYVPQTDDATADWCAQPVPGALADRVQTCCERRDHPIHRHGDFAVQHLARNLCEVQWRTDGPDNLRGRSEHRRHIYDASCAICTGDVHALAAAVWELTRLRPPMARPQGSRAVDIRPRMPHELGDFLRYAFPDGPPNRIRHRPEIAEE